MLCCTKKISKCAWGEIFISEGVILNLLKLRKKFTKKTHLQFFKGNPFTFFSKKKSTLKFCLKFTGKSLYNFFLKKNPFNLSKNKGTPLKKKIIEKSPYFFFKKNLQWFFLRNFFPKDFPVFLRKSLNGFLFRKKL